MATEPARRMHAGLRRKLGAALAEDVITVLAPLERDELAQRSDVVRLEAKIDAGLADVRGEIVALRGEIKAQTGLLLSVLIPIMVGLFSLVLVIVAFAG